MPDWLAWDTPSRLDTPELIDDPTQPYPDFRESMTDVRRANRFLGGTAVVQRQARHWLQRCSRDGSEAVRFLDVATGSGDIPQALIGVARAVKIPVEIVGLDYSVPILRFAREQIPSEPAIRLLRGDAFALPFADNSFDYALCSLAFHHFSPAQCVCALREMERVSKRGWIVNDLRRARSAWWLIRAITWLMGANRLTRHDAPASVLRAYSLREYATMPEEIGLRVGREVAIRRSLFYRVALIRDK